MSDGFKEKNGIKDAGHSFDYQGYQNLLDVFGQCCQIYADRPAFSNMGLTLSYAQLDELSNAFAAYLHHATELQPGDRIAIQLPNLTQYPVVLFGAFKAGLVVVNTNPQYTPNEMLHQFQDAGVKAIVVLANFASKVTEILDQTDIQHVFITEVGDMHPQPQRFVINSAVKWVKRAVVAYDLPQAVPLLTVLKQGGKQVFRPHGARLEDVAALQYTGGTTGVAKAAVLTHANLLSNMLQVKAILTPITEPGREIAIAPLPLYHIYSFTVNCMVMLEIGAHIVLIPNPRDLPAMIKELKRWRFTIFSGLNTLFVALCKDAGFQRLDFSRLHLTLSGGMALNQSVADRWQQVTGCEVVEGYGLTETSPVVSVNLPWQNHLGTIGPPLLATDVKVVDEAGNSLVNGEVGELCVRGPQVMREYWQQPEETAQVMDAEGWFKTGDMAQILDDGCMRIIDRKKDMIIVSGFNVYPNEVENVLCGHQDIEEAAVVGIPDEVHGEVVKAYVVSTNPQLTLQDIQHHARQFLTSYKVPHLMELCDSLPKTNVGKVLRRELRNL